MAILRLIATIIFFTTSLSAMQISDFNLTLAPPPPPKPKVLGIQFGTSPDTVAGMMQERKVKLLDQKDGDERGVTKILSFNGLPEGMSIESGISRFFFFKNELVRMVLEFPPSYHNFLIIRGQLMDSLGERFSITKKEETMDTLLRQRLTRLDGASFQQESEKMIEESILEGKTFFYYNIADRNNELNIVYAFITDKKDSNLNKVGLTLNYVHRNGAEAFQEFQKMHTSRLKGPELLTPLQ